MARLVLLGLCLLLPGACGVALNVEGSEHDVDWSLSIPF